MSRYMIVDSFRGVQMQMTRGQIVKYLELITDTVTSRRYATLALNHFTCGRLDQTNAALAKLGIVFYRVDGEIEKRRGVSGYQIRKLPNRPGTRSEHRMGSYWEPEPAVKIPSTVTEPPRFVRTPQGTFPLNYAARNQRNPEHPQLTQGQGSKPRKPWWRFR